jgi:hypothetical protein
MPKSPMTTVEQTVNHAGGVGFVRDAKSELFQLAVVNMVGHDTFYEKAQDRDDRFVNLVHQVAVEDAAWLYRFLGWLRNKANMRSASIVVAAEAIRARLDASGSQSEWASNKSFIPQAMARADEPGEFLAYWTSKYGKKLPQPVKRGLALAAVKLYDEYSYAKYGRTGEWQMADVVEMVHPGHRAPWQADLWKYAIDVRHNREVLVPASLPMLQHRDTLMAMPQGERASFLMSGQAKHAFKRAGLTWEAASGWLGQELSASFWENLIPAMGYMALLRNLRNFERAGISRAARKTIQERLSDPEQVARSRQFPYRFLSAYRATESDMWSETLSDALDASVGNLPSFPGRTLVLVDTSGSMQTKVSEKSSVSCVDIGALFGVALAASGGTVDLYGFASGYFEHKLPKGASVLRQVESFTRRVGEVGHGTETVPALRATYKGHDRVILVTDMQAFNSYSYDYGYGNGTAVSDSVPADIPMFGINPLGYKTTALDLSNPNRFEVGGFSDQVFRMIGLLASGKSADWPF